MITFTLCLLALIVGYFTYGRLMERVFGPDDRKTPALTKADGVDYIPLPTWKIFMIQFLNIAGLGPIFGAIMGAKFGSSSYLWIVLGSIFAGAVHDYFAGMLSLRHEGESLPEIIGRYLGLTTKQIMRGFTVILMILVGSVFVAGPAGLLAKLTPESLDATFWIIVVFAYYILATLLPVDKIIGKIYLTYNLIYRQQCSQNIIRKHNDNPERSIQTFRRQFRQQSRRTGHKNRTDQNHQDNGETSHYLFRRKSQIASDNFRQTLALMTQGKHSGKIIVHRPGKNTSQHNP